MYLLKFERVHCQYLCSYNNYSLLTVTATPAYHNDIYFAFCIFLYDIHKLLFEWKVTTQEFSPQQVLHFNCLDMAQWPVTGAVNHAVIVTHFILFCIMVTFDEPNITHTSLSGFVNILKELLLCHMFSYPKTYVMDVCWRKETEWHKPFPGIRKCISLKIIFVNDTTSNLRQPKRAILLITEEKVNGGSAGFSFMEYLC